MPENEHSSARIVPRAMAPNASKSCYYTKYRNRNVRMLVAHKKATKYPAMKETDGAFFIDEKDCYTDVLAKMATHCMKPVSRIFYIDSDDDELPIDSDVEFKEALKLIGQRTDKGRFTSMRIETGESQRNDKKGTKKPSKVARVKVTAKLSDASPAKKGTSSNRAESEPKLLQKNSVSNVSSVKACKHGISHTWLKNYLHQFKKELMTDFESLLEPYIAEQKKMNDLIISLNASLISEKNCAEKCALPNLKGQTESDHNYSASASSLNAQVLKGLSKAICSSKETRFDETIPLSEDEEIVLPCSHLDERDDDNLSIYSGEISVTESESDGSSDDFVDVPLPSCFDVVAIQKGLAPKRVTKEMKHMKTSLKVKMGKVSKYEVVAKCQKPQQKSNSSQKPELNGQLSKKDELTPKQVLSEQTITSPSAEKPQPHKSANVPQMAPELGNTNNVRFGFTTQTMPHGFYQSYTSPLSVLGSENAPVSGVLADPLGNQGRKTLTYRLRPCSTFVGPASNQTYVWGHIPFAYNTAQTLGQTQTQPTTLSQPQAPQQQTPPTMPRQLPQQMSPQLPLQLALHHQQAMSQMASIQPLMQQMQPQLLQPLPAQLQKISRDDISGRQSNPQDSNRIETTYNGMQLHDFTPVATETTYPNMKSVPAGFCPNTYGGMMKN